MKEASVVYGSVVYREACELERRADQLEDIAVGSDDKLASDSCAEVARAIRQAVARLRAQLGEDYSGPLLCTVERRFAILYAAWGGLCDF